jgi:hypothetical protein
MFSCTSTRSRPPVNSASARVAATAAAAAPQVRADIAAQAAAAAAQRAALEREHAARLADQTNAVWGNSATARFALKALIAEAMRRDIAAAAGDSHAVIRIRSGWDAIARGVDSAIESAARGDGAVTFAQLLDTISVAGVWFPDVPSPAYGRRPQAILDMYYRHIDGRDISAEIASFDRLHRSDTGRACAAKRDAAASAAAAAAAADDGSAAELSRAWLKYFQSFAIADAAFALSPFVAQSRELRQLATLRRVQAAITSAADQSPEESPCSIAAPADALCTTNDAADALTGAPVATTAAAETAVPATLPSDQTTARAPASQRGGDEDDVGAAANAAATVVDSADAPSAVAPPPATHVPARAAAAAAAPAPRASVTSSKRRRANRGARHYSAKAQAQERARAGVAGSQSCAAGAAVERSKSLRGRSASWTTA